MTSLRITQLGCLVLGLAACKPAAVSDAAAPELEIKPAIIDVDPAPADGKVPVVVQFYDGGAFVQLGATSSVTCNGVALSWNGLGYAERVPIVAAGGNLTFAHVRDGVTTQLAVAVPARPVVMSPTSGATLPRTRIELRYVAATSAGVRPSASDGTTSVSGSEQPDSGSAMLDVSMLHPGAGTLDLARRVTSTPSGTGFASASATYTISSAPVAVVWQ